jgi:hypothetical protein
LQLSAFVTQHETDLGPALATAKAAVESVNSNLEWFEKYREDISAWMAAYTETTTSSPTTTDPTITDPTITETPTTPGAATSLSFNPILSIIIVTGYMVAKY